MDTIDDQTGSEDAKMVIKSGVVVSNIDHMANILNDKESYEKNKEAIDK